MKIAIVSDDGQTISRHFGRAKKYIVYSCEQDNITERKTIPKIDFCHSSNRHRDRHKHRSDSSGNGFGRRAKVSHEKLFDYIKDCDILLSRGMGQGAYRDLQHLGIRPVITDIEDIKSAIQAVMDETIIDHVENLH